MFLALILLATVKVSQRQHVSDKTVGTATTGQFFHTCFTEPYLLPYRVKFKKKKKSFNANSNTDTYEITVNNLGRT